MPHAPRLITIYVKCSTAFSKQRFFLIKISFIIIIKIRLDFSRFFLMQRLHPNAVPAHFEFDFIADFDFFVNERLRQNVLYFNGQTALDRTSTVCRIVIFAGNELCDFRSKTSLDAGVRNQINFFFKLQIRDLQNIVMLQR